MHRHQLALFEGEKEGSLGEVEVPPCWFSLSHRSPTCYLHVIPPVTTVGLQPCCRLKQVGRTTHRREVLGSRRIRQSTHQYPDRHDSMVRACLFSLDSCSDSGPPWRHGGSGSVSGRSTAATATEVKDLEVGGQGSPRNYVMSVTRQHGGSMHVLDIELVSLKDGSNQSLHGKMVPLTDNMMERPGALPSNLFLLLESAWLSERGLLL